MPLLISCAVLGALCPCPWHCINCSKWAELSVNGGHWDKAAQAAPQQLPMLIWGPQSCARHERGPPLWSEGAAGLAQVCFCPGVREAHPVPVILSGVVLGHVSRLEHSGPAEVGSHSWFLPLCQVGVGNLPCAHPGVLSQLPGEVLYFFSLIHIALLGDICPGQSCSCLSFPVTQGGPGTHPSSHCSSHL